MAARNINLTTVDDLLKDDYVRQQIIDTVNRSTVLLSRIKSRDTTAGRKFIFPVQFGVSQGVGARAEFKQVPDYGWGEYDQATGNVKYLYSTLMLTGQSMSATKGSKVAFADVLKQALKDARDGLKLDVQRQVWSDGTGIIAKVSGVHSGVTTLTPKQPLGLTYTATVPNSMLTRHFKRNMNLYIDASTDQQTQVTAIGDGSLTVGSAITAADGDNIYRGDSNTDATRSSKDNEIEGILKIVAATGSYLGIDRTGFPEWQSTLVAAASNKISDANIRGLLDTMSIVASEEPNLLVTTHAIRALYEGVLTANKRFVNPMELEGGYKALEFDGMPLVVDKDAPAERLWALNTNDIVWFVMEEFDWMDKDGAVLNRVSGKDAYEATMRGYKNLACLRPANQGVLTAITTA